jgi:hypothetical protein
VVRIILYLWGRSRALPACSARSNLETRTVGPKNLVRAAVSSSVNGSPSNLQQIAATTAAFAWVGSKAGEASSARSTKSPAASRSRHPNFGAASSQIPLLETRLSPRP